MTGVARRVLPALMNPATRARFRAFSRATKSTLKSGHTHRHRMQLTNEPAVSIVIRCYNEAKHIGRLLTGIKRQTEQNVEVIVVDSGSTDETLAIASRFPVKILHIKPEHFSFGRALNLGCEASRAPLLLFASAHVYPLRSDWVAQMLAPFDNPRTGVVYGRQVGDTVSRYSERQIFAQWFPDDSIRDQSHYFCNNANAAIRRSLWDEHRYDESLTGLEDLEMAQRLQQAGFQIDYQAEAAVVHIHEESYAQTYNRYRREATALARILPEERFSLLDFLRLFSGNVATDLYHAWREGVLAEHASSIARFRLAQFWGTYRGSNTRAQVSAELRQRFYYPNRLDNPAFRADKVSDPALIDYSAEDSPNAPSEVTR